MNELDLESDFALKLDYWKRWKDLDYIDWDKNTREAIQHNLRTTAYRVDVGAKALYSQNKKKLILLQDLRKRIEKQAISESKIDKILEIQKDQRSRLINIQQELTDLRKEYGDLKQYLISHRPLTKKDVEKLVIKISEQPKFIEKQTEALTEELTKEVHKLKAIIQAFEKRLIG